MLSPDPISARAHRAAATPIGSASLLWLALAMLAIAAATILGALGFEHIGGYLPCALCLMQRTPYYIGVPLAALRAGGCVASAPRAALVVLFGAFAALMLYGGGLAVYHSGVEWGFWEGPAVLRADRVGVGKRGGYAEPARERPMRRAAPTRHGVCSASPSPGGTCSPRRCSPCSACCGALARLARQAGRRNDLRANSRSSSPRSSPAPHSMSAPSSIRPGEISPPARS